MEETMLVFKAVNGLANRLTPIASILAIQKIVPSLKLRLFWDKHPHCEAYFEDLFDIPNQFTVERTSSYIFTDNTSILPNTTNYISTHWELLYPSINIGILNRNEALKELKIKEYKEFEEQANRIRGAIGVHIRHSDNTHAIRNSPVHLFVDKIQYLIDRENQNKFFIATDEDGILQMLIQTFGDKILYLEKPRAREYVQTALLDLYLLNSCIKIYGSQSSTFSDLSSYIKNMTPMEKVGLL